VVLAKTLFLVQENLPAPALHATKSPVPSAHDTYYSPPQHIYITQRPNLYLTHRQKKKTKNIKHKTKKEMKRKERKTHENTKKSKKESGLTFPGKSFWSHRKHWSRKVGPGEGEWRFLREEGGREGDGLLRNTLVLLITCGVFLLTPPFWASNTTLSPAISLILFSLSLSYGGDGG